MNYVTKSASVRVTASHVHVVITSPPSARDGPSWRAIATALRAVANECERETPHEITDL